MTDRELFVKTVQHLAKQKYKASVNGHCVYRGKLPNGDCVKCAAGCHIPDEAYKPGFEGKGISADTIVGEAIRTAPIVRRLIESGFFPISYKLSHGLCIGIFGKWHHFEFDNV